MMMEEMDQAAMAVSHDDESVMIISVPANDIKAGGVLEGHIDPMQAVELAMMILRNAHAVRPNEVVAMLTTMQLGRVMLALLGQTDHTAAVVEPKPEANPFSAINEIVEKGFA